MGETRTIELPKEVVDAAEAEAKSRGMSVGEYVARQLSSAGGRDRRFDNAAKKTFESFPKTLKKLAE